MLLSIGPLQKQFDFMLAKQGSLLLNILNNNNNACCNFVTRSYFFFVFSEATKISAMEEQWEFFVSAAKDKAESHTRAARFWGRVDTFFGLSLIFLSGNMKLS